MTVQLYDASGNALISNLGMLDNTNYGTTGLTTKAPTSRVMFDHNAAIPSATIHPNTGLLYAYLTTTIADVVTGILCRCDIGTIAFDLVSGFQNGNWYGASGAYRQAKNTSNSTTINDDTANFVAADINNARVQWASNALGTINTGSGYITSSTSTSLTISKGAGADFAASYYYWIKKAHYAVPVTGYYLVMGKLLYPTCVANKPYRVYVLGNNTSIGLYMNMDAVTTAEISPQVVGIVNLSAGDKITLLGYQNSGGAASFYGGIPYCVLMLCLLRGQ